MEQHDFLQGSAEWHQHRATHFNASDAPAMLGVSPYKSRTQLLDELATGITPDVDAATQRRFDDGHRAEALARPLAEKIIGRALYPVVGSEGRYSASFDGLTSDDSICFEHKSLNGDLRECMEGEDEADRLPELYRVQMEQQLMVSGAERCLFMASKWDDEGNLIEERHCWYQPDPALRERIVEGWAQFEKDLATHKPAIIEERPQAQVAIELPALFVTAHGAITDSNMEEYGRLLKAKLAEVRAIKLVTDQDFSNAKEAARLFREQCQKLKLAKEAMLAQTMTIGEAARMMDAWHEDLRVTALQLEKDVEREDMAKKSAMVMEGKTAYAEHLTALEAEIAPIRLSLPQPDFAAAIKSKRNYASMQDAIATALASAKISAETSAKDIRDKLAWCKETSAGYGFLFSDLQQIIVKPLDDFKLLVTSRIANHKLAEAEKLEGERQRMEAEAKAKAEREAAEKLAAEEARIRAEERAKAEAETKARAEAEAKLRAEQAAQPEPSGIVLPPLEDMTGAASTMRGPAAPIALMKCDGNHAEIIPCADLECWHRAEPADDGRRTMKLGEICALLGFTVTADFLSRIGFQPVGNERAAKLYRAADFPRICDAIAQHVSIAAREFAQVPA
jgi:putative phage-type endonuclease